MIQRHPWAVRAIIALLHALVPMLLTGCAGNGAKAPPPPRDIELANSEAAADSAYARGSLADAASLYQRALTRARAMDDPQSISAAAYNLAACDIALGHLDAAPDLLIEARDETLRAGGNTADVLLVMAKVALLRERPDEALSLCDQVLSGTGSRPTDEHLAQIHLLRGQIACGRADLSAAGKELDAARKLAGVNPSPARAAGMENLSGTIEERSGRPAQAAAAFDREAEDYRDARLFRDMARALGRAGAAYESAGQLQPAGERFFRAARSALAQGNLTHGRRYRENAMKDASNAHDKETLAKARALSNPKAPTTEPAN